MVVTIKTWVSASITSPKITALRPVSCFTPLRTSSVTAYCVSLPIFESTTTSVHPPTIGPENGSNTIYFTIFYINIKCLTENSRRMYIIIRNVTKVQKNKVDKRYVYFPNSCSPHCIPFLSFNLV